MIRFPPRRILVPLDFTPPSLAAFRRAREWAFRFKAQLDVLYVEPVVAETAWNFEATGMTPKHRREIVARLRVVVGPDCKVHFASGDPVVLILRAARATRADLIVMGSHGRRGLARFVLGSVSEAVVRLSPVPVLAVRGKPKAAGAVLAPTNLSDYAELGVRYAAHLAAALEKPLTLLNVGSDPRGLAAREIFLRAVANRIPAGVYAACRPTVKVRAGSPTEEIVKAARASGLIVIAAHRKTLLKEIVLGTTAERVLRSSAVPVLAVPVPSLPAAMRKLPELAEPAAAR